MQNLKLETADGIAIVTVHRPDKLNALNAATFDELETAFHDLEAAADVRGVIVTGSGEKAFVAGADIVELAGKTALEAMATAQRGQRFFRAIELFPKPVVAAVNGFALGGGCELAMACHIRLAAENATFGLPEVGLGTIPGYGGTQRLARLVGRGRAIELVLTGQRIPASEAHRIGLVNRVVPAASLLAESRTLLQAILKNGPIAVRCALAAIQHGLEMTTDEGMQLEASLFGVVGSTSDMVEGMRAFLEKRPAQFRNA